MFAPDFQAVLDQAKTTAGQPKGPFPSPADWRDQVIYFLMVDRFNNPHAQPVHTPFDDPNFDRFQGGKFSGIQEKLGYIKGLGVGAIWLSPVLKNFQSQQGSYHGYGIHDFLHADPRFADKPENADNELRALVDAAHAVGLYVIFDIVLNHTGDAFAYTCDPHETTCINNQGAEADFRPNVREVIWRDRAGVPHAGDADIAAIANRSTDALVWPSEFQLKNDYYRRQGKSNPNDDVIGDFDSLKQFRTDLDDVQRFLIRAYQYVIARYDIDAYRIDTLRYLQGELPRLFGNSMREFALSIGKKNFFTFGEVLDGSAEQDIAKFIGRSTSDNNEMVGVDAALDYPLFNNLKPMIKGFAAPADLVGMYSFRKQVEADKLSSHGDATRFFVTFIENHDMKERIRFVQPGDEHRFDDQVTLGVACLECLPGIPCLYYGSEAGLSGAGSDAAVREALWGGPGFHFDGLFYKQFAAIAAVRNNRASLRYGRFYFRPLSGDGNTFGISGFPQGVLAFSRILNDEETLIVANTSATQTFEGDVILDINLSRPGDQCKVLYSNKANPQMPKPVQQKAAGKVSVNEPDGETSTGPLNSVHVKLGPLEVQILAR